MPKVFFLRNVISIINCRSNHVILSFQEKHDGSLNAKQQRSI